MLANRENRRCRRRPDQVEHRRPAIAALVRERDRLPPPEPRILRTFRLARLRYEWVPPDKRPSVNDKTACRKPGPGVRRSFVFRFCVGQPDGGGGTPPLKSADRHPAAGRASQQPLTALGARADSLVTLCRRNNRLRSRADGSRNIDEEGCRSRPNPFSSSEFGGPTGWGHTNPPLSSHQLFGESGGIRLGGLAPALERATNGSASGAGRPWRTPFDAKPHICLGWGPNDLEPRGRPGKLDAARYMPLLTFEDRWSAAPCCSGL